MNTLLYVLLIPLLTICSFIAPQHNFGPVYKTIVIDHAASSIQILGTTNVNEFSCSYEAQLSKDTFQLKLMPRNNQLIIEHAIFSLPISYFNCENTQMTKEFRSLLNAKDYPAISIQLKAIYQDANVDYVKATIGLAGVNKPYEIVTQVKRMGSKFYCTGKPELCITDFGLKAPEKLLGLVKVNEDIQVKFALSFYILE